MTRWCAPGESLPHSPLRMVASLPEEQGDSYTLPTSSIATLHDPAVPPKKHSRYALQTATGSRAGACFAAPQKMLGRVTRMTDWRAALSRHRMPLSLAMGDSSSHGAVRHPLGMASGLILA